MSGLPNGWVETTLEELCEFNPKHDPETNRSLEVNFVPMPAVDDETGTIVDRSNVRPLSEVWKGYTHFSDRDVIFAKITPCMENGKIAVARDLANGMACGSTEFHVLRSKGAAEPDFLWRFLRRKSYRQVAERSMTGAVGQRRVPRQFLEATVLPLPPLAEQKRIVAKLDALHANSARARTELARIEALVSRYKQAVLSKAFSGELARKDLGDLVVRIKAGKNLRCEERPPHPNEKGVVKVSAVTWGEFRSDQSKTLPPDFEPDESTRIRSDDFLFSRANTIELVGAVVIVAAAPDNLYLSDKILRFEFNEPVDAWLLWYLRSPMGREALMNISSGNQLSMRNIGQKSLLSLSIPYADAEVRTEIVRHIESAFAMIDRLAAEARRALELVGKLDEAILAKAFRGELVAQDENDEPAQRLLERIRAARAAAPKVERRRRRR